MERQFRFIIRNTPYEITFDSGLLLVIKNSNRQDMLNFKKQFRGSYFSEASINLPNFLKRIKVWIYIWFTALTNMSFKALNASAIYLDLSDILKLKIRQLRTDELQKLILAKLMLSKKDCWIINCIDQSNILTAKSMHNILHSKLYSGGVVVIFTNQEEIYTDVTHEYNFYQIDL